MGWRRCSVGRSRNCAAAAVAFWNWDGWKWFARQPGDALRCIGGVQLLNLAMAYRFQ
jgi:hypothetical protein